MSDILTETAVNAGRIARQRQGLPDKLIDPVLIERLAVLFADDDTDEVPRDDAA